MSKAKSFQLPKLRAIGENTHLQSDICYHLLLEKTIHRIYKTLDISGEENNILLASIQRAEPKAKKKLFSFKKDTPDVAPLLIRRIVRTHLKYLLFRAELLDLIENLQSTISDQQDIVTTATSFPEALNPKAVSPKQAVRSLSKLLQQAETEVKKMDEEAKTRETEINEWLKTTKEQFQAFIENTRNAQDIALKDSLSEPEQLALLRIMAGVFPDSMLPHTPDKNDSHFAQYQEIKKLCKERGVA